MSMETEAPGGAIFVSPRKKRGEGAGRRDEILAAAKEILVTEGYGALSIRKLAAKVGISSTALYVYFQDKDHIIEVICHETFGDLTPVYEALNQSGRPAAERLKDGMIAFMEFALSHPAEFRIIFMIERPDDFDHRGPKTWTDRYGQDRINAFHYLVEAVRAAQADGALRAGPPMELAELAFAALYGALAIQISDGRHWPDPKPLITQTVDFIMRGLRAECPGTP